MSTPSLDIDPVATATDQLEDWLISNGLAGWDPYDVMGHPLFRRLAGVSQSGFRPTSIAARVSHGLLRRSPLGMRRVLGVKREVNAKGVGLLLSAWLRLSALGDVNAAKQAVSCTSWLVDNADDGPWPGVYWGYPFDWNSRVFIPKGTPSAVVTSTCGQALLDFALSPVEIPEFSTSLRERALEAARGAAVFLSTGLNRHDESTGSSVLSYTPLDDFRVHNASLMAGEYLLRCSRVFDEPSWRELALALLNYTLADQAPDGSFEYWGPGQRIRSDIDNYHTGFVLRSIHAYELEGAEGARDALEAGWAYYRDVFFEPDGRPLNAPGRRLPLNIHSCAEAILCPATLTDRFPEALPLAEKAARWSVTNMANSDGSFAYLMRANGTLDRTPHLRWGQAWMMRALSELRTAQASRPL